MSSNAVLQADKREGSRKRRRSQAPAGWSDSGSRLWVIGNRHLPVTLDAHDTSVLFHRISVDNTIVSLEVQGAGGFDTLVREVQVHPYRPAILPRRLPSAPEGRGRGRGRADPSRGHTPTVCAWAKGIVEQNIHSLAVRCIPSKIPKSIVLEITALISQLLSEHLSES